MNTDEVNELRILRRALETIRRNSTCKDPEAGSHPPYEGCAFEVADSALRMANELAEIKKSEIARVAFDFIDFVEKFGQSDPALYIIGSGDSGHVYSLEVPDKIQLVAKFALHMSGISPEKDSGDILSSRVMGGKITKEPASWNVGLTKVPEPTTSDTTPPASYGVSALPVEPTVDTEHEMVEPGDRKPNEGD